METPNSAIHFASPSEIEGRVDGDNKGVEQDVARATQWVWDQIQQDF